MVKRRILEEAIAAATDRRRFLGKIAAASAGVAAMGAGLMEGQTAPAPTDADILNFALNLEYLEAQFYTVATTGMTIEQVGIGVTGTGNQGTATGGKQVNLTNNLFPTLAIANEIANDERSHVTLIREALTAAGAQPIAQPAINLNALGIGFGSVTEFLTLSRAFEDVGVTAYAGAAPLISSKTILGTAAQILAAEAEHVANIRLQIAQLGIPTTLLDGVDILPPPSGQSYFSLSNMGLAQTRTPGQVLSIVYGGMANVTSGGFFPNGVNGTINMSSSGVSITNITNAVVTPTTLTTNQPSIVLDGSASTSGSGNLTYLFMVVPGGKQPALLQAPSNPKATVDFVNGPGLYLVQLIVTDGSGNTSKSGIVMLTYQP
ncbi:MAG: ferritin-like domain-containing protein [Bryobacterales bacterium]|nr:ferritin-like domain-containing protein [Bryobacterales bacterium]